MVNNHIHYIYHNQFHFQNQNAIIEKESFSASATYQTFSKSTYTYSNIYVATTAVCPAYEAS